MKKLKLFMLLLGCKPKGRHTEQHDVFFGIADELKNLVPDIIKFWPEAEGKIHIDAWREVIIVDNHSVTILEKTEAENITANENKKLFFINLGGYKQNDFEEYHYKLLSVADNKGIAIQQSKQTAFYKHTKFETAESHIDDKYGIDVDDMYEIEDVLPAGLKQRYHIAITATEFDAEDEIHIGYFKLDKL